MQPYTGQLAKAKGVFMIREDKYRKIMQELIDTEFIREQKLLQGKTDMYGIYQIMDEGPSRKMKFMDMDFLKSHGEYPKKEGYLLIYEAPLSKVDTLEGIYTRFNTEHPEDYYGHSLSVSDVVAVQKQGKVQAFFLDSIGFTEILDYFGQDKAHHLENMEYLLPGDTVRLFAGDIVKVLQEQKIDKSGWSPNLFGEDSQGYEQSFHFEQIEAVKRGIGEEITRKEINFCGYFSIFEGNEQSGTLTYIDLQEAFCAYFTLPTNLDKKLVFQSFRHGALPLVQCKNGLDVLVEDYKNNKKWKNPDVYYLVEEAREYLLMNEPEAMAFKLPDQKGYFLIQKCEDGVDFTLYDADYKEIDGGQWDTPSADGEIYLMCQAVRAILKDYDSYSENLEMMDYQELSEKVEEVNRILPSTQSVIEQFRAKTEQSFHPIQGNTASEIEQLVLAYAQATIEECYLEIDIVDAVVYGSRSRGLERPDSDVDVVLEYKGEDIGEDDLFNLLHEDNIKIGNVPIDINPICEEHSGNLGEYLRLAEIYLGVNLLP